jgi:hypothetical protein
MQMRLPVFQAHALWVCDMIFKEIVRTWGAGTSKFFREREQITMQQLHQ